MFELKPDRATGAFAFDTDVMAGRIEPAGAYHGIGSLIDKRSGRQLIHPDYSALNLFRLFAHHQAMGQPRFMERSISAAAGGVEIRWPPTAGSPPSAPSAPAATPRTGTPAGWPGSTRNCPIPAPTATSSAAGCSGRSTFPGDPVRPWARTAPPRCR